MSDAQPFSPATDRQAPPIAGTDTPLVVKMIADRYGWPEPMARWWRDIARSTVGPRPEAMIAFLDRTVGGVTMIRRR